MSLTAIRRLSCLLVLLVLLTHCNPPTSNSGFPDSRREFRGVWVATVGNIDWPSSPTLTTGEQKAEIIRLLDLAQQLNLNAIIFQVRPQCDAFYNSAIEPWSEFLTGQMGKAPAPYYDPLEFAVAEAHARGLQLHAWFNPFRALDPSAKSLPSPNHISQKHPDLVKKYGSYLWLDPGEKEVQDYSLSVIVDVVKRYDIDGVHLDDYFYPYPQKDESGEVMQFPDESSWHKYVVDSGGKLSRDDWRRQNVNEFVRRVSRSIKEVKPSVQFGISPFGIWQPDYPPGITGLNAYEKLYADSRKWLREGWIDYLSPQLYWPIKQTQQSYTTLLDWWISQNTMNRHLWPGNSVNGVVSGATLPADELVNQIEATRLRLTSSTGNIHFSMRSFLNDRNGINDALKSGVYAEPALIPATPWIDGIPPEQPVVTVTKVDKTGDIKVEFKAQGVKPVFLWVAAVKNGSTWKSVVIPGSVKSYLFSGSNAGVTLDASVAVSAVDRLGNESKRTVVSCCRDSSP